MIKLFGYSSNNALKVIGVMGGIANGVDTYAPEYSGNEQVHQDIFDYFEKVGNVDDIKSENSTVINIADTVIQDSMAFVMLVTAALMAIVFVLTFRLKDKKIKK